MASTLSIDNLALSLRPNQAQQRPFIFVHGNTQNDTCGKGLCDYFFNRGHSVLSYDLPGHGDSKLETEDYTFDDLVALNFEIIKHFGFTNPILCGHSLGGMIQAATIAQYRLSSASLILCGSYDANPVEAAKRQSQAEESEAIDAALAQYIADGFKLFKSQRKYDYYLNRSDDDEIVGIINRRYTQPQASAQNLTTMQQFHVRDSLIELSVPLLALHGEKEDVIPRQLVESMITSYPDARVAWYANAGHYAFYQYPEMTNKYLDEHYEFIAKS